MELKDTISLMTSNDYKERLKAEYFQLILRKKALEERLKQLSAICPTKEYDLLFSQRMFMTCYAITLERRAREIYGIHFGE